MYKLNLNRHLGRTYNEILIIILLSFSLSIGSMRKSIKRQRLHILNLNLSLIIRSSSSSMARPVNANSLS